MEEAEDCGGRWRQTLSRRARRSIDSAVSIHRTKNRRLDSNICLHRCQLEMRDGRQGWPVNAKMATAHWLILFFLPPRARAVASCPKVRPYWQIALLMRRSSSDGASNSDQAWPVSANDANVFWQTEGDRTMKMIARASQGQGCWGMEERRVWGLADCLQSSGLLARLR